MHQTGTYMLWPICKRNSRQDCLPCFGNMVYTSQRVYHIIPLIKEMFYDLELEEECADILDKFPWMTSDIDAFGAKNKTNNIQMGTKVLGKNKNQNQVPLQAKATVLPLAL